MFQPLCKPFAGGRSGWRIRSGNASSGKKSFSFVRVRFRLILYGMYQAPYPSAGLNHPDGTGVLIRSVYDFSPVEQIISLKWWSFITQVKQFDHSSDETSSPKWNDWLERLRHQTLPCGNRWRTGEQPDSILPISAKGLIWIKSDSSLRITGSPLTILKLISDFSFGCKTKRR